MIAVLIILTIVAIALHFLFKILAKRNDIYEDETCIRFNKLSKFIPIVLVCIMVCLTVFTSFYTVSEDQQAVVTMFGKVQRTDSAGIHWKLPVVQHVKKIDITTHGTSIGYTINGSSQTIGSNENPQMITSDFNLINVDFYMEYRVNDPIAYLYNSNHPEEILSNIAMSCIRAAISDYPVDDVMTTAKSEIQLKIRENLSAELDSCNIGIQLVNIMIQDVEPPTSDVFDAFKSVESAKQGAETDINDAKTYKNENIPAAEAEADKIIQQAEAEKARRIAEAEGQVARFNKMYDEYINYPLITKKRLFFETMEELLPDLKIIISDGTTETMLPLEPFTTIGGIE